MKIIGTGKMYNFCYRCEPERKNFLQPIEGNNENFN